MQAWRSGVPMLAPSGYRSQVDADVCIGCGDCSGICQFGALSTGDGIAVVDAALCMGCGVCVSRCAQGALSLVRDPTKGEPLEIRELLASVGNHRAPDS
jgi:heterodisulfide reductase subunit A-like polyferredoxin